MKKTAKLTDGKRLNPRPGFCSPVKSWHWFRALILIGGLLPLELCAGPAVLTAEQIEADWLNPESLRQAAGIARSAATKVSPEQDAAGGCDGVIDGKWGFHTENEDQPWWQVDLGAVMALDRVVLYNRCDSLSERNSRIKVLSSENAKDFRQVYQHDGTTFYGYPDKKPLSVAMQGVKARYVRLQLPGKSYFHLDEVQVYPVGETRNIALGKPATQSSVSQWSALHTGPAHEAMVYPVAKVLERGLRLASNLAQQGVAVEKNIQELHQLDEQRKKLSSVASDEQSKQLYLQARWAVRRLALKNPLLNFDSILFCESAPGRFPHMSDQFYGWWSRPGGGIFVLENFKSEVPQARCLTADLPEGSYLRPDLSYDGKKVLFAYCRFFSFVPDLKNKADKSNVPEEAFYHIYEMNIDGSQRRQLTHGRYDDFDARYLPNGEIVFLSTRKGTFLQCNKANSELTLQADLPDSYVRCGGDNYRPVPVFTLHIMDNQGHSIRPLSAFENFEWTPAIANDGRVLYTRWDYIDRFNGPFFSLWSTNPDGSNPQLVYGNYTVRPQVVCEAMPIPNSHRLVFVATAHHSILGGSLVLLDRNRGLEDQIPLVRLTPEVPFPETEANVNSYYANPWPLSEEHYLTGWANRKLPPHSRVDDTKNNPVNAMGVYLYDSFGNLTLLYRDANISSGNPIPVRPRVQPPVYTGSEIAWNESTEGTMLLQNVYDGMPGIAKGSIKSLRVIGVPPKVQPHMNTPVLGISAEDPGKLLLGTVPVEPDGSAYFRVPAGMPVFFQAVDQDGLAVQTMRSLTYVWPKQTLSCVGCHEGRDAAPASVHSQPLAIARAPSKLSPGPAGTWPLRFDQLVQPVLDQSCVSCHRPDSQDRKAAKFDLTPVKAYDNLLAFGQNDLRKLAFERDRSYVGDCAARKSKLLALLKDEKNHAGVHVDSDSLNRLTTWMDLYAQRQGQFSPEQEQLLAKLRQKLAPLFADTSLK